MGHFGTNGHWWRFDLDKKANLARDLRAVCTGMQPAAVGAEAEQTLTDLAGLKANATFNPAGGNGGGAGW